MANEVKTPDQQELLKIERSPEGIREASLRLAEHAANGTLEVRNINASIQALKTNISFLRLQLDYAKFQAKNPHVPLNAQLVEFQEAPVQKQ